MAGVPYVFGNATTSIPLTNLDANFNTGLTIGNTTVGLGNTVTTLGNVTLTNATLPGATGITQIANGTSNVVVTSSGGAVNIATNGTQAVTIDTNQNVGIGNTTPNSYNSNANKLVIGSNSAVTGMTLASGASAAGNIFFARGTTTTDAYDGYMQYSQASRYLAFGTNGGNERMRIDSIGNILINQTAPVLSAKIQFTFDGSAEQGIAIKNSVNNQAGAAIRFIDYLNASSGGGIFFNSSNSITYATSSDYRLKENIAPMTGALTKIQQLKPVTFNWKQDNSASQGFLAHELQAIIPEAVIGTKDGIDADGNPRYQGVDTSYIVATLTAAIQELKAINDTQAETINALTDRVVALEAK